MKCEDCKYWEKDSEERETLDGRKIGVCRLNSPTIVKGQLFYGDDLGSLEEDTDGLCGEQKYLPIWEGIRAVWPDTMHLDWCGEFQLNKIDMDDISAYELRCKEIIRLAIKYKRGDLGSDFIVREVLKLAEEVDKQ
jgi:hypothetical protein